MKLNIKKYIYSLLGFVALQQANAQVIFKDDFGQSTTRKTSQYVPQGGADDALGNFDHGSSFYKFAEIITVNPWEKWNSTLNKNEFSENQWSNIISDGYYAVVDPQHIYSNLPSGKPSWATWWVNLVDHTPSDTNGAALVVNAGQVKNQFYRRAVALEKGKTYKISAYILSSGTQSFPNIIFEAQNIETEVALGASPPKILSTGSIWTLVSWNFKIPNSDNCTNVAVALRNNSTITGGNDLYIDDITLEEVVDPTAVEISCSNSADFSSYVNLQNDSYNWANGTHNIISNDQIQTGNVILTGANKNATISTIGNWPSNVILDPNTGQITITGGTKPTGSLTYQVCNLIGICSTAQITFLGVEGVFNPGTITNTTPFVCYEGSSTVTNVTKASSTGINIGAVYSYDWQFSYDSGVTWTNVGDAPEGTDGSTGEFGEFNVNGSNSITVSGIKKPILIRRKAKRWSIPQENAFTAPVLITPQTENIILFPNNINAFTVEQGGSFNFPVPTSTHPSTFEIKDMNGNVVTGPLTNLAKGEYYYTVEATTTATAQVSGCKSYTTIQLIVYNLADCNISIKKHYATHYQMWTSGLSGVANPEKAVNSDRSQYATITGGVVLLGIGTVGIDLYFTKPDGTLYTPAELKGKKVTIKLGEQYSGLKLAGGLSVVARSISSLSDITGLVTPLVSVGKTFGVKGGVLDVLKGDNVFEFSFTPTNNADATIGYNGIRIQLGSLLGVADLATVFHAFIEEEVIVNSVTNPCDNGGVITVTPDASLVYPTTQKGKTISNNPITLNQFAEDATWGNYTEVLNVASGLSSVTFPYYAIDNNYDSYAIFNTTAGVLNKQFLNVRLRQKARPGDQIQIVLGTENVNVLNLGLLNLVDYKIKYFLGDSQVGEQELDRFKVLDLGLLNFSNEQKIVISTPITVPFDRVQLEQWNTVNVNLGNQLYVYDMRVNPQMLFEGQTDTKNKVTLCAADYLGIQKMDVCTGYEVSFAHVTQYGDQLRDENGNLMVDSNNIPVLSIVEVQDVVNSQLDFSHTDSNVDYYNIKQLYTEFGADLLVKIQTKRQGCNYGDAQYLRVNLLNCNDAIVNPVIKTSAVK